MHLPVSTSFSRAFRSFSPRGSERGVVRRAWRRAAGARVPAAVRWEPAARALPPPPATPAIRPTGRLLGLARHYLMLHRGATPRTRQGRQKSRAPTPQPQDADRSTALRNYTRSGLGPSDASRSSPSRHRARFRFERPPAAARSPTSTSPCASTRGAAPTPAAFSRDKLKRSTFVRYPGARPRLVDDVEDRRGQPSNRE